MKRALTLTAFLVLALVTPAGAATREPGGLLPPIPARHLLTEVGAPVPPPKSFRSGFLLETEDGYRVGVETYGSAVILVVYDAHHEHLSETAYLARGIAAPKRLQATFGQFGKVRMRFHEARNRPWYGRHRVCHGAQRFVRRRGVFTGDLRFRGEGGYVSVHVHRVKGTVVNVAAKCLRRGRGGRHAGAQALPAASGARAAAFLAPGAGLLASTREGVNSTTFLALEFRGKTIFFVGAEESRGKLAIVRFALARAKGSLPINEAVTAANLAPPAPFHGTGRYRAAPDGTSSWSGDLTADFPGAARYPLTGPRYSVSLEVPF